jgi:hypothetical protein
VPAAEARLLFVCVKKRGIFAPKGRKNVSIFEPNGRKKVGKTELRNAPQESKKVGISDPNGSKKLGEKWSPKLRK